MSYDVGQFDQYRPAAGGVGQEWTMSVSEAVEVAQRIRLSDPRPDRCAACFRGADETVRFVDFDAAIDRGTFTDPDSLAVLESIDDLHLCEACVRQAAEVLDLKADLHSRQLRKIRELELAVEHWQAYAKRAEATVNSRPDEVKTAPRRRKAA